MCIPALTKGSLLEAKEISEAVLAAVWNEQQPLRGPMWDCEGEPVAVVYRGIWTAGSGPDFERALLALGEGGTRLVTGSVEMHLRCGDWYAHGHDKDPRYNSVALHVVLWPHAARPVIRQDGASVPTLVLADYITLTTGELLERVTPLISNLGALSEEPCWQRTQDWPLQKLVAEIEAAGDERILAKAAVMEAGIEVYRSTDEVFYRGLMDALGYSANRKQMKALASALPLGQLLSLPLGRERTERATLLESLFLGAGGLLPSQRPGLPPLDWLSAEYAEEVEELWRSCAVTLGLQGRPIVEGWNVDRVRPPNSPARRLAAAARLLSRLLWERGGMIGPFTSAERRPTKEVAKKWTEILNVPGDGYWGLHSDFGQRLSGDKEVALVGAARSADIAVNVLLPLLVAQSERAGDSALGEVALEVWACYPKLAENKITRAMADEALGPRQKEGIKGARHQQGLIHLYKTYCATRRCYECPLSGLTKL